MLDRLLVGTQQTITTSDPAGLGEGTGEHQQRRFREVKVCDQGVDDLKSKWRVNEEAGVAAAGDYVSGMLGGDMFKHTHSSSADGHDPTPGGAGGLELIGGTGIELESFAVHEMAFDSDGLDGSECAESDMQSDVT